MIAGTLSRARTLLGCTQDQLAREAGSASAADVSRIEHGVAERCSSVLRTALRARITAALAAGQTDTEASAALDQLLRLRAAGPEHG